MSRRHEYPPPAWPPDDRFVLRPGWRFWHLVAVAIAVGVMARLFIRQ